MHSPIPLTSILGAISHIVPDRVLDADHLQPAGETLHHPLRHLSAVPTASIVWALVCIIAAATTVALVIATATRRVGSDPPVAP